MNAPNEAADIASLATRPGLSVHDLQCIRDDRVLFDNLSFHLTPGRILQIEGHNGSGKTSLLRILCGLSLPTEGEVRWDGKNIQDYREEYYRELNYFGHAHGIKGELTPLENLNMAATLGPPANGLSQEQALREVGLRGFEDVPARALSAGQQRRVALARLLIARARLWILDEPFTALDHRGMEFVEAMLDQHARDNGIAVITSHHAVRCALAERLRLGSI